VKHTPPTPARWAAFQALQRVRSGELADRAFERAAEGLDRRARAWALELLLGTLRLQGRIDHLLTHVVRPGLDRLEPAVLDVLRLGAYQLLAMDSVPAYAAISQSVELVRAAGAPRAAGLVNGVLRTLSREAGRLPFPDPVADPVGHLSTWGSHPRWLLERWLRRWPLAEVQALVEANNRRPELYVVPLGLTAEEARQRLAAAGIEAEPSVLYERVLHVRPPAVAADVLAVLPAVVQDPGAALVAPYAAPPAGARVFDLCAAPGGKSLALADRGAQVVAADVAPVRVRKLRQNVERVGWADRVRVLVADGRQPPFPFGCADLVLLDVPCTGTGTLRRHPDARWRLQPEDLERLPRLQAALLEAAAPLVRAGGWLVYSTCSLEPEENEMQIERFLAAHPEFAPDPSDEPAVRPWLDERGFLVLRPQRSGVDGAFAARLRRCP